jgi:Uma2 family endonuclease
MGMPAMRRMWTVEEVRELQDESRPWPRYELIHGQLLVTPAPGGEHQIAAFEICRVLDEFLDPLHIGLAMISPADIELQPDSIVQPDVFVVPANTPLAGEFIQWTDVRSLLLAVEIISPRSARRDRGEKRKFYLDNKVPEYWVVDLEARTVERWGIDSNGAELVNDRLCWTPRLRRQDSSAPNATLEVTLPELFDRIERKARILPR